MKIALVSPYDFAFPGGVANHISSLEHQLTQMGHEVKVIAPASEAVNDFGDRFIPIGRPRSIPSSGSICRISISLNLAGSIKKALEREKFDILHLHEPFMPMLCSATLRFSDTVNIGTFHASNGSPGYNVGWPLGRIMLNRRRHKLDGMIAVSEPARDYASQYVPGHYEIIPNGIDLAHFTPDVSPIEEFCDDKLNILFVGRLEKRKGLEYLLRAYRQVKQEVPNSRLIAVGPGTRLRKQYEKWVRRSGLGDIVFVGRVSYADLPRYYKTADVYCSPATSRESFGIVLLEAMAVGKPVIASNIEGYANVLTHGEEGWLVPPKNSGALARALTDILKDEPLRQQMIAKGKITAARYGWEQIAQQIVGYYRRVLNESPRRKSAAAP
jgi:phosphatidylinositol alpha-mannosyltransferase